MASIVRRQGEDFNSSLNCCETDLKLLWRPLAASLQSYLKTPRIKCISKCVNTKIHREGKKVDKRELFLNLERGNLVADKNLPYLQKN